MKYQLIEQGMMNFFNLSEYFTNTHPLERDERIHNHIVLSLPIIDQYATCTSKLTCYHIDNFRISFIGRQANRVAHRLVEVPHLFANCQYFDYIHPCNLILNEMVYELLLVKEN